MKLKVYTVILQTMVAIIIQAQPAAPTHPLPPTPPALPAKPLAPAQRLPSVGGSVESLDRHFFAPELIMKHQKAISLSADQQKTIRAEMRKMMAQFTDLQWQESAETEALEALVKQERPDEKPVLAQLDKLLDIENQIKRLHTGMLVRIKNILTSEQQAQLQELARNAGPRPRALRDQNK